jgi:3-demethoxyubiquinol 3-hydroxylase|tara:strand:- start:63 stop:692 length:630 start_codon:yes stop_codon:yes gene_type:complete
MHNQEKSLIDSLIGEIQYGLTAIYSNDMPENHNGNVTKLDKQQRLQSERIMRINHMGEICAQALYRGQAAFTKEAKMKSQLYKICDEENHHLELCNLRLTELNGKKSILNPLWYSASFALGALAGLNENQWKLGFIEETEKQVKNHLEDSIASLPAEDSRSKIFLEEIAEDEEKHRDTVKDIGSEEIPEFVKRGMAIFSKIMKKITYHI